MEDLKERQQTGSEDKTVDTAAGAGGANAQSAAGTGNGRSADAVNAAGGKQFDKLWTKEMRRRIYPNGADILAMIGCLLVALVVTSVVSWILGRFVAMDAGLLMAITYVLQMGLSIALIMWQRRSRQVPEASLKKANGRLNGPLILWGILLIFVTGVVIEPLLGLLPEVYLEMLNSAIGTGGWTILTTVVLAPIMEETLFRGLIQGAICRRDGATKAILISALLFGVFHFIPQQAINAFFVGIILGYIYFRTGSLLTVIIIHALNNAMAYIMLELLGPERANIGMSEMLGGGTVYYIVYGLSVILLVVGVVMMIRRLKAQDKACAVDGENTSAAE